MKTCKPSIVYLLTNVLSGKSYVGITCSSLKRRWIVHVSAARRGRTNSLIGKAIRKYGADCWMRGVLERCETRALASEAECRWIADLETMGEGGYNLTTGGDNPEDRAPEVYEKLRGRKMSEESKRLMSEKARQRVWTPEMRAQAAENLKKAQANGAWNKGMPCTPSHREHLRRAAALRGPVSQESIEKRRQKMLGRKMSPEAIEKSASKRRGRKLSEAHIAKMRGRVITDETRLKISKGRQGRVVTEEIKRKMSESQKRAWAEHPEAYENMRKSRIGVPLTEEQKRKIGEKNRVHALERIARKRAEEEK